MLKSLRNRILAFFLLVALVIAGTVFPLNYFHNQKALGIRKSVAELNEIYIKFIKDLKYTSEFISLETTNPNFFITGESPYLKAHDLIGDSIVSLITAQSHNISLFELMSDSAAQSIKENYEDYCIRFDSIVLLSYKRGYRFLGVEGEMMSAIYSLEKNYPYLSGISDIRASEREYLNRNDLNSIANIQRRTSDLQRKIHFSTKYSEAQKAEIGVLIQEYTTSLQRLVELDTVLGLRNNTGMRKDLTSSGNQLESKILSAINTANIEEDQQLAKLNFIFAIISILLFASTIALSIYLSRYLVNHLEKLTKYISQLSKHDFNHTNVELNLLRSSKEIREIYKEFRNMVAQIRIKEKQRDLALSKVKDSEQRYRELTDLLPQSIFETDRLGNLVYANKAWYEAFGYAQDDLEEGLNLIEILQTDTDNNLFGISRVENSDNIAIRKDNSRFPALVYADTIKKDNQILGRRGIIIDATLRNKYIESLQKEAARAVSSDKLKSSFLANMSHEIRTPMNSIIGFANLLSTAEVPEDHKEEFIHHIQSSGQLLLNLIDDIIDIAKIEAGEIKIKSIPCEPVNLISELVSTFEGYKTSIGKSGIRIKTDLPDEEIHFKTDSFRLRQILSNLASNAIKFTETGSVTISCEVKNDQYLEFAVEDTGMGMTKEELNIIFSRFQRTTRSEEKNISGTGLGLAISKNLVELLGGQMWVSSVPGEGSCFSFQLPYKRIPLQIKDTQKQSSVGREGSIFNWKGRTILVAEDDENSYVFLKEVLQKTNARIVHAVNGKEVVEAVKFSDDIDIILMDMNMPFLDGYTATKMIKEIRPSLPIIAQTAYAMDGDKEKSIMAGCDDYLTKPINPPNLLAKMNQFMPLTFAENPPDSDQPNHQEKLATIKKKQD